MAPTRGRRSTRGRPDKAAVYGRLERHNHGTMDNERSENESGKLENNTVTSTEEGQEQGSEQEAMETSAETESETNFDAGSESSFQRPESGKHLRPSKGRRETINKRTRLAQFGSNCISSSTSNAEVAAERRDSQPASPTPSVSSVAVSSTMTDHDFRDGARDVAIDGKYSSNSLGPRPGQFVSRYAVANGTFSSSSSGIEQSHRPRTTSGYSSRGSFGQQKGQHRLSSAGQARLNQYGSRNTHQVATSRPASQASHFPVASLTNVPPRPYGPIIPPRYSARSNTLQYAPLPFVYSGQGYPQQIVNCAQQFQPQPQFTNNAVFIHRSYFEQPMHANFQQQQSTLQSQGGQVYSPVPISTSVPQFIQGQTYGYNTHNSSRANSASSTMASTSNAETKVAPTPPPRVTESESEGFRGNGQMKIEEQSQAVTASTMESLTHGGTFYMRDHTDAEIHDFLGRCSAKLIELNERLTFYAQERVDRYPMPPLDELAICDDTLMLVANAKAIYKTILDSFDNIVEKEEDLTPKLKEVLSSTQWDAHKICEQEMQANHYKRLAYEALRDLLAKKDEPKAAESSVDDLGGTSQAAASSTASSSTARNITPSQPPQGGNASTSVAHTQTQPSVPSTPPQQRQYFQQGAQHGFDPANNQSYPQQAFQTMGTAVPYAQQQGFAAAGSPVYTNMPPGAIYAAMRAQMSAGQSYGVMGGPQGQGVAGMPYGHMSSAPQYGVMGGLQAQTGSGMLYGNMSGSQQYGAMAYAQQQGYMGYSHSPGGMSSVSSYGTGSPQTMGSMGPPPLPYAASPYQSGSSHGGAFNHQLDSVRSTPRSNRGGRGGRAYSGASGGGYNSPNHQQIPQSYDGSRKYSNASSRPQTTPRRGNGKYQKYSDKELTRSASQMSDKDATPRPRNFRQGSEPNPLYQGPEQRIIAGSPIRLSGYPVPIYHQDPEGRRLPDYVWKALKAQTERVMKQLRVSHGHPHPAGQSTFKMPKIPQPVFEIKSQAKGVKSEGQKKDDVMAKSREYTSAATKALSNDPVFEQESPKEHRRDKAMSDLPKTAGRQPAEIPRAKSVSPSKKTRQESKPEVAKAPPKIPEWEVVQPKKSKAQAKATPTKLADSASEQKSRQRDHEVKGSKPTKKKNGRGGKDEPIQAKEDVDAKTKDIPKEFSADMKSETEFPSLAGPSKSHSRAVSETSPYLYRNSHGDVTAQSNWGQQTWTEAESSGALRPMSRVSDIIIPSHICTPKPEGSPKLRPTAKEFTPFTPTLVSPTYASLLNQDTPDATPVVDRKGKGKMVEYGPDSEQAQALSTRPQRSMSSSSSKLKVSVTAPVRSGKATVVATIPVIPLVARSAPGSRAASVISSMTSPASLPAALAVPPVLSYAQKLALGSKAWDLSSRPEHQINRRVASASSDGAATESVKTESAVNSPLSATAPPFKPGSSAKVGLGIAMERTSSRSKSSKGKKKSAAPTVEAAGAATPVKIATGLPAGVLSYAQKAASAAKPDIEKTRSAKGAVAADKASSSTPPVTPASALRKKPDVSTSEPGFRSSFRPADASTTAAQLSPGPDSWAARLKQPYRPVAPAGSHLLTNVVDQFGGDRARKLSFSNPKLLASSWRAIVDDNGQEAKGEEAEGGKNVGVAKSASDGGKPTGEIKASSAAPQAEVSPRAKDASSKQGKWTKVESNPKSSPTSGGEQLRGGGADNKQAKKGEQKSGGKGGASGKQASERGDSSSTDGRADKAVKTAKEGSGGKKGKDTQDSAEVKSMSTIKTDTKGKSKAVEETGGASSTVVSEEAERDARLKKSTWNWAEEMDDE